MANGQDNYNPMQTHMGLLPQQLSGQVAMPTPHPSDTSLRLMEQAQQRITSSLQTIQSSSVVAAGAFGAQFQQRFQQAQGFQSLSPYQAQMMGGMGQQGYGGGPSYLPSPLTMTPAHTGVFRPPMPSPTMPIPPMYTPPIFPTPFTPQQPRPMFQTSWDQQAMTQDLQSQRMFSYGMQVPSVIGQAAGIGAGAYAGAKLGGMFGPMGRIAGAIGGGIMAARSGVSETLGDFSQLPFRPMAETRMMGAAVQRMSQDWVVSGPQLHATGRGLTQQAGIELAGGIKDLSTDKGFKEQTGGMFNRQDLMRMTQMSGQAGLMDMAQSVPAIQQQLKQVAVTVRRFMELTNDPDVTNVLREMGQMRQFGMTMPQITQAADNMRLFSRAAGTSIAGLRNMGGLPGASVYQGMGLSAAQGFEYGNYSLMQARQTVASGGVSTRQLAMLGGVQGMAQRNMQAQAAFLSMPMFAAANANYQGGGDWDAVRNPQGMGGGRGAFGMVTGAVGNLNAAVRRGGVGALVSFPLEQREIADAAASRMTPMEQTAQRFRMARETGRMFGMKGMDAFNMGARLLYGDEVAGQMAKEARSSDTWITQMKTYDAQLQQVAVEQRQQREDSYSTLGHLGDKLGRTAPLRGIKAGMGGVQASFRRGKEALGDIGNQLGDEFLGPGRDEGIYRLRLGRGRGVSSKGAEHLGTSATSDFKFGYEKERGPGLRLEGSRSVDAQLQEAGEYMEGLSLLGDPFTRSQTDVIDALPIGWISDSLKGGLYELGGMGKRVSRGASAQTMREVGRRGRAVKHATIQTLRLADEIKGDIDVEVKGSMDLQKAVGDKGDSGAIKNRLAHVMAEKANDYYFFKNKFSDLDYRNMAIDAMAAEMGGDRKAATEAYNSLGPQGQSMLHAGGINAAEAIRPGTRDKLGEGGKEWSYDTMEKIGEKTKELQDKQQMDIDTLAKGMGFRIESPSLFGIGGYTSDATGREDFDKLLKDEGVAESTGMAAVLAGGKALTRAKAAFMKAGGTEAAWKKKETEWTAKTEGLSEENRKLLTRGGYQVEKLSTYATALQRQAVTGAVRGQAFGGKFGAFSATLTEKLQSGEVSDVKGLVGAMSEEELTTMSRKEGATGELGKLGLRARKGDKTALRAMTIFAGKVGPGEKGLTDTATEEARGQKDTEKSSEAAGEMALVAEQFAPAVSDFAKASKILLEAAEIRRNNVNQGRITEED